MSELERTEHGQGPRPDFHRRLLKSHGEAPAAPGTEIETRIRQEASARSRRLALLRQRALQS